jgi:hypothetical protein
LACSINKITGKNEEEKLKPALAIDLQSPDYRILAWRTLLVKTRSASVKIYVWKCHWFRAAGKGIAMEYSFQHAP